MNKEGYVYVLYNPIYKTYGDNVYKVGRAIDLDTRLKSFITSYIEPSTVKFSLRSKYFIELEKKVHKILKQYRINPKREYFNCDLDLIVKTIEKENDEIYRLKNKYENKTENIQYKNKIKKQLTDYDSKLIRKLRKEYYELINSCPIGFKELYNIIERNNLFEEIDIFDDILRRFFSNDKGEISVIMTDRERLIITGVDKMYNKVVFTPEKIVNMLKNSCLNDPTLRLYYKEPTKGRHEHKVDNINFINEDSYNIVPFKVKDLSLELLKKILRYNRHVFKYKNETKYSTNNPEIQIKFIEE